MTIEPSYQHVPEFAEWSDAELLAELANWYVRMTRAIDIYDLLHTEAKRRRLIHKDRSD